MGKAAKLEGERERDMNRLRSTFPFISSGEKCDLILVTICRLRLSSSLFLNENFLIYNFTPYPFDKPYVGLLQQLSSGAHS